MWPFLSFCPLYMYKSSEHTYLPPHSLFSLPAIHTRSGTTLRGALLPTYDCDARDDAGACVPGGPAPRPVLAAYYSYTVLPSAPGPGAGQQVRPPSPALFLSMLMVMVC